jgi:hypothetical protein
MVFEIHVSAFDRAIPDPESLARLMAQLETPMEEHEAMIEAIDWARSERFKREIETDPRVHAEWERFHFGIRDDEVDEF